MQDDTGISKEVRAIIKERIETMEAPGYEFPEKFSSADWAGAVILIVVSFISIVAGVWM